MSVLLGEANIERVVLILPQRYWSSNLERRVKVFVWKAKNPDPPVDAPGVGAEAELTARGRRPAPEKRAVPGPGKSSSN